MKLTHENVNTRFESARLRELMHDLVAHENEPKVLASGERIYSGQVRFFWRFSFPLIVLIARSG